MKEKREEPQSLLKSWLPGVSSGNFTGPCLHKSDKCDIMGRQKKENGEEMAQIIENSILIQDIDTKNVMTKSNLPVGGYSVNPYVGCTHACKYCYASFMKRFTGHTEPWGTFLDVKHWPKIKSPKKYAGQRLVIGSVTDGYNPQEELFCNTRKLLEQLKDSGREKRLSIS